MTFLAWPAWIAWTIVGVGTAACLAAFLVRSRPSRRVVSSLVVLQQVLARARERSRWERLRWLISLAVTLSIAVLLAAALVQPVPATGGDGRRVLIILDSSWTMSASRATGGTRWEEAIREASSVIRDVRGEVALATTAEGVVDGPTSDRAKLSKTLARLVPSGASDVAWPRVADADAIHFITDGATSRNVEDGTVVHSVFQAVSNVAISAFEVEKVATSELRVFVLVTNFATIAQTVDLAVSRGDAALLNRRIEVDAGATHREIVSSALEGDPRFRASIQAQENALGLDDTAEAYAWDIAPVSVGLVGPEGPLTALAARDRTLRVTRIAPDRYDESTADVWIFDGWLPPAPPVQPTLVVDPPKDSWLGRSSAAGAAVSWRARGRHPVLAGVDSSLVRIASLRTLVNPALMPVALTETGAAIVSADDGSSRRVVLHFALSESNLQLTPAFPVLVGNAIDWLGRPERGRVRPPGPVVLPQDTERVLAPDGRALPLVPLGDRRAVTLDKPGLYLAESANARRVLNVRLNDMRKANLMVSSIERDREVRAPAEKPTAPWWIVAALIAVMALVVEWFTWDRRITV